MYRYFTTRFGIDTFAAFEKLKAEFPTCKFSKGNRKGQAGIWAIFDTEFSGKYGEAVETVKGDWFQGPENHELILKNIHLYESPKKERITINLENGIQLRIFPASAIPRRAVFSLRIQDNTENEIYNTVHPYGAAAYALYFRSLKKETVYTNDPEFLRFVYMAISESYTLPIELIDYIGLLSITDLDTVCAAAFGIPQLVDEKKKLDA